MGPQAHPYNPYQNPLNLAARMHQQQQQSYTDMLLKSYENHIAQRFAHSSPTPVPGLATSLYSPAQMGLGVAMPPLAAIPPAGLSHYAAPGFQGHMPPAPPGSFQHLLASMTSAAAKAKHAHVVAQSQVVHGPLHVHTSRSDQPMSTPSPPASVTSPRGGSTGSGSGTSENVSPVEQDRRSSSIAVLRMKAREYEMKLQMGQKCVY